MKQYSATYRDADGAAHEIAATGADYNTAHANLAAQVPEGGVLLYIRDDTPPKR